jgi:hypothetical protein
MFFVIMPRVLAILRRFDNPGNAWSGPYSRPRNFGARTIDCQCGLPLLSAGHANYHGRDIFHIDERVEKFRASEVRKVDNVVGNLRDFASELFSRSQVQLDSFAGTALKDAQHARIRLQGPPFPERANWSKSSPQ